MKAAARITEQQLRLIRPGQFISDPGTKGAGSLQARGIKGPAGYAWYFRYTDPAGASQRLPMGSGLSLKEARKRADELSRRYQDGDRDLKGALDRDARKLEHAESQAREQEQAAAARAESTLGVLLRAYPEHLHALGKKSHKSVLDCLHRHVRDACPAEWQKPIHDVTTPDLVAVVSRVLQQGKKREASKLRSYLISAFRLAMTAKHNISAPTVLQKMTLLYDPAAGLLPIKGAVGTSERALSQAELRSYWRRIAALDDVGGALLRFHILTGSQRMEQLGRVRRGDFDSEMKAITIYDIKGPRSKPRVHVVPLVEEAEEALGQMAGEDGDYMVSITAGASGASADSIRKRVRAVSDAMVASGEATSKFTPADLRRTVETRLAALGVNRDARGQVQSHGLGGLQDRHYDRYDYIVEKRSALAKLRDLMIGTATIHQIPRSADKAA